MIKKRNIVVCILLSFVTCGIYGLMWFISLTNDAGRANNNPSFSGGKALLLTLITCGIYGFIWNYKIGKEMYGANQNYGLNANDNSVLYLILSLFGLSIVTYCIVQSE
ncbi:MAG: DUF4234 domain-containing protein, partial [Clostridia bacterium]|nr:DUF4234 domain-containing protein [Clostridia bacterium]